METYHDIYDRIAKRCLTLSNRAIVRFINGVYGVDHDLNSKVTYHWTEHVDDDLKRTLADTIITINHTYSYHIEFQIDTDGSIIFRILDYGFHHALKNHTARDVLEFPEPVVIYLYEGQSLPDEHRLTIQFGNQGTFEYTVPVIKYLTLSREELDRKKMIILIPFQLLKLRKEFEVTVQRLTCKERTHSVDWSQSKPRVLSSYPNTADTLSYRLPSSWRIINSMLMLSQRNPRLLILRNDTA